MHSQILSPLRRHLKLSVLCDLLLAQIIVIIIIIAVHAV